MTKKIDSRELARAAVWYSGVGAILLIIFVPLMWVIAASFSELQDIFANVNPFSLRALYPAEPTLEPYREIFAKGYGRAVVNTLGVSAVTIFAGLLINSMSGFVFAKVNFRFRTTVFLIVLLTAMVPFEAIAVPLYNVATALGLRNTFGALILPGLAHGLVVFLFKQFFEEIPTDLIEVTFIDGGSWWQVFTRIFLPLSKPAMIAGSLILFLFQWNAFLWPLIAAPSQRYRLIQVAIANLNFEYQNLWNEVFAASLIGAVVPVVLILIFQKYFVRGIATSGMK